ncbi:MAG TPA: TetR/AcrR family transcriptional regulator [Gemmatimonadaceae bacterium]|nr:TetR/AcrR family transcriptional regulator [Gemmatimonadaceae bacterium]
MRPSRALRLERSDTRMHALLEAALEVFALRGYRTARLDDVADAAGVTKGAIYHYFDTKEALLIGVIEHYQALAFGRAEDALREPGIPATARIRLLLRKVFGHSDIGSRGRLLTLLLRGVAHEVPRVHERWLREGPARLWAMLASLVEEGKKSGEFRPDADGEVGARVLVSGLMLQRMWQQHAGEVPELAVDYDRLLDSSVELFIASLRGTGGG